MTAQTVRRIVFKNLLHFVTVSRRLFAAALRGLMGEVYQRQIKELQTADAEQKIEIQKQGPFQAFTQTFHSEDAVLEKGGFDSNVLFFTFMESSSKL